MLAIIPLIYGNPSILDRLMDQAEHFSVPAPQGGHAGHFPPLQIFEDDGILYVRAILPGVTLKDLTLTLEPGILVLQGATPRLSGMHLRCDRPAGPFKREIPLPFPVDAASVSAIMRNGLLTVILPTSPAGQKRAIPVRSVEEENA